MPLDEALGIAPHQGSSEELMRLGCLLSVMMPYEQASWLLKQWGGLSVSASTLWNWVQAKGKRAMEEIQEQLEMQAKGEAILPESLSELLSSLPLIIGADGVMVPFRPVAKTPNGEKSRLPFWLVWEFTTISGEKPSQNYCIVGWWQYWARLMISSPSLNSKHSANLLTLPQTLFGLVMEGEVSGGFIVPVFRRLLSPFSISSMLPGISGVLPMLFLRIHIFLKLWLGFLVGVINSVMVSTIEFYPI